MLLPNKKQLTEIESQLEKFRRLIKEIEKSHIEFELKKITDNDQYQKCIEYLKNNNENTLKQKQNKLVSRITGAINTWISRTKV